jgi:hypothetical protein
MVLETCKAKPNRKLKGPASGSLILVLGFQSNQRDPVLKG